MTDRYPIRGILESYGFDLSRGEGKIACEFHGDKHPSAMWSEFYFTCFACGVSGDAVRIVKDQEGLSWSAAYDRAASLSGDDHKPVPTERGPGPRLSGGPRLHMGNGKRRTSRGR